MCNRLICDGHYYICDDCWEELLEFRAGWPDSMTVTGVREAIDKFMDTNPGTRVLDRDGIEDEFERLTRQRPEDE
jgi:hypothetical protein